MLIGQALVMYPALWVGSGVEGGSSVRSSVIGSSLRSRERGWADKAMSILDHLRCSLLL